MKKYIKPNIVWVELNNEFMIALSSGDSVNDTVPTDDDEDNSYTKTLITNHCTWDNEW